MPRRFKLHCSYSCIVVTLQLDIVKMVSLNRKRLSLSEKYKIIIEVESETKRSKVAEKYGVPRNTISA